MEVFIHILAMTAQDHWPNHEDFKSYTAKVKNLKTILSRPPLIEWRPQPNLKEQCEDAR